MKTIYFIRHGNAKKTPKGNDSARPLSKSGVKLSTAMAKSLQKDGFTVDAIASSPAIRALETAYLVAEEFRYKHEEIIVSDLLYQNASIDNLFKLLGNIDDKKNSIVVVGHNPQLSKIVAQLLPGFALSIPTSGIIAVTFDKNRWVDVKQGEAQFKIYRVSVIEDTQTAIAKVTKKELEKRLRESMIAAVKSMDEGIGRKLETEIDSAVKIVSKKFFKTISFLTVTDFSKIKEEPKLPKNKVKKEGGKNKITEPKVNNAEKGIDIV